MKNKVAMLIIYLLTSNNMEAAKTVHSIYLVTKSGLVYEEGSKKPFSGFSTDYHENGRTAWIVQYKRGILNGEMIRRDENGILLEWANYRNDVWHGRRMINRGNVWIDVERYEDGEFVEFLGRIENPDELEKILKINP